MNPLDLIREFYEPDTRLYRVLVRHSEQVAQKAIEIAQGLPDRKPDMDFLYQAAWLHDIAIFQTNAPEIGCRGNHPYVVHGILGRKLLEEKRLDRHALVCERHVGAGISARQIHELELPLPMRDMIPQTIEEIIVCVADKFFSKKPDADPSEKPLEAVLRNIARYGGEQLDRFRQWIDILHYPR